MVNQDSFPIQHCYTNTNTLNTLQEMLKGVNNATGCNSGTYASPIMRIMKCQFIN